jgi:RNase P/RNase MRP subunit p29
VLLANRSFEKVKSTNFPPNERNIAPPFPTSVVSQEQNEKEELRRDKEFAEFKLNFIQPPLSLADPTQFSTFVLFTQTSLAEVGDDRKEGRVVPERKEMFEFEMESEEVTLPREKRVEERMKFEKSQASTVPLADPERINKAGEEVNVV